MIGGDSGGTMNSSGGKENMNGGTVQRTPKDGGDGEVMNEGADGQNGDDDARPLKGGKYSAFQ